MSATAANLIDLAGPARLSMDDILREIQKVLGKRRLLLHHPAYLP